MFGITSPVFSAKSMVPSSMLSSSGTPSSCSFLTNDLPDLNPRNLIYLRQQIWGDKLLRKLSPDQVKQFLAEQPYTSSVVSTAQKRRSRYAVSTRDRLSRSNTFRQNMHILAVRAAYGSPKNTPDDSFTTTDVSDDTYKRGNTWIVPGVGEFTNKAAYIFDGTTLPTGLTASDNNEIQGNAPYPFRFDASNVTVADGTLNLKVPGGQDGRKRPISCAEVTTDETTILHGSIRMTAKMSAQAGVCHGAFFYRNDQAESDIEYLTDPTSQSNRVNPDVTQFWYSNQATMQGGQPSHKPGDPPAMVEGYHTYRLDWTADYTAYYVDGKLQSKLTDNIPNKSGMWVWNNWTNGDQGWSCGPPKNDSIFRIKDITMYYNTLNSQP